MSDMHRAKRQLLRRLKELGGRLEDIEAELLTHSDPDWDDMALKREGDEVLEALGESGQREIVQIRAALDRIAAGSYGTCVSCGEKIGPDRLAALPATPLCRNCAQGVGR
jgi:RNA polymerase-binding transcription factor DksA